MKSKTMGDKGSVMKTIQLSRTFDLRNENKPLLYKEEPTPTPEENEIVIRVSCCGICHTEIDEVEGRTAPPKFPIVPGHQVIGIVEERGMAVTKFLRGDRVGVAWIFSACGKCEFCQRGEENLCPDFMATGRDVNGGYEEYMTVREDFAYAIPEIFTDEEAAPLLCAGAIGYRSLKLSNIENGQILGLTGFGASGHLVLKLSTSLYPDTKVIVFARSNSEQEFAKSLGAVWAGEINDVPPFKAHSIIDTTPVWNSIVGSLNHLVPGGRLVINAIRKEPEDIDSLLGLNYQKHLWMEKEIKSVANITRKDVVEFLRIAAEIPIKPSVEMYPFEKANEALLDMKHKNIKGAKVLKVGK